VKRTAPWTPLASDFQKSSTRVMLSVVCLDGRTPAVVTQSGLYENEILTAYDHTLKKRWQFNSFAETSGSGGHKIEARSRRATAGRKFPTATAVRQPRWHAAW